MVMPQSSLTTLNSTRCGACITRTASSEIQGWQEILLMTPTLMHRKPGAYTQDLKKHSWLSLTQVVISTIRTLLRTFGLTPMKSPETASMMTETGTSMTSGDGTGSMATTPYGIRASVTHTGTSMTSTVPTRPAPLALLQTTPWGSPASTGISRSWFSSSSALTEVTLPMQSWLSTTRPTRARR